MKEFLAPALVAIGLLGVPLATVHDALTPDLQYSLTAGASAEGADNPFRIKDRYYSDGSINFGGGIWDSKDYRAPRYEPEPETFFAPERRNFGGYPQHLLSD